MRQIYLSDLNKSLDLTGQWKTLILQDFYPRPHIHFNNILIGRGQMGKNLSYDTFKKSLLPSNTFCYQAVFRLVLPIITM